jgi:hypothetical protein
MESKKNCQAYESSFYLLSSLGKSFDNGKFMVRASQILVIYFISNPTQKTKSGTANK